MLHENGDARRASGEPLVVAFVDEGAVREPSTATVEALRAELRGLGASLLVVAETGGWRLGSDDALARWTPEGGGARVAADEVRALLGLGGRHGREKLFVLDGGGIVRLAHPGLPEGSPLESLLGVLSTVRRQLRARPRPPRGLTRRQWISANLVGVLALVVLDGVPGRRVLAAQPVEAPPGVQSGDLEIELSVNGSPRRVRLDPRVSLLDALRERMGLTGTKKGCDHGQCGACTVLVDGRRVLSCLTLAVAASGSRITTIEGLAHGEALHPVQAAFLAEDGYQCGYCTPGQIMSAVGMLAEGHARTDEELREQMSGNLCRCGAYPNILAAVRRAREA